MNAEKRIRAQARALLSEGNWGSSVAVFFILFAGIMVMLFVQSVLVIGAEMVITPLFEYLQNFSDVFFIDGEDSMGYTLMVFIQNGFVFLSYGLGFLYLFPLYCGIKRYYYLLSKGEGNGVAEVFYYLTKKYKKCLSFGLRYGLLCIIKLLPCVAPLMILIGVISTMEYIPIVNSILIISAIATGIAGVALWILWTSKQFLSIYLFIEDDSLPAGFYAKESVRIVNINLNKSVRKLNFSFIGWFLLALTGVGMLYFVPYYEASIAISAKWMIKLQKEV